MPLNRLYLVSGREVYKLKQNDFVLLKNLLVLTSNLHGQVDRREKITKQKPKKISKCNPKRKKVNQSFELNRNIESM